MSDLGTGESDGFASAAANMGGIHQPLIGESDGAASATATAITTTGGLLGSSTPSASATAHLGGSLQLSGESDGHCTTITSDLTGVTHIVAIAGSSQGGTSTTATMTNRPALAGSSAGSAGPNVATLSTTGGLVSSIACGSATAATMTVQSIFAGESDGAAATSAEMTAFAQMRGHSGATKDMGNGTAAGSSSTEATITITGAPNVALSGST